MSVKTIFIITITVIITVFLTLNTDPVSFNLIFTTKEVSKLVAIGGCFLAGFLVGILVARPRKKSKESLPHLTPSTPTNGSQLSQEDMDYLDID